MAAEDASLIERILDGDDEAFDALVGRHLDRGRAIAGSIVPDGSAVDDIVQEAFIRAHRALGSLSDPIAFPAWFGRIVHNEAISWLRRNRRRQQVAIEDEARLVAPEDPGPDPAAEERGRRLRQALGKLRPAYRQILALKYEARLSYEEIADTLGLSLANVEKKLYRARQRLQQLMDQ